MALGKTEKTSFEIFKEWEKNLSPAEYKEFLGSMGSKKESKLGVVDFKKYARGIDLICKEFEKNHPVKD